MFTERRFKDGDTGYPEPGGPIARCSAPRQCLLAAVALN